MWAFGNDSRTYINRDEFKKYNKKFDEENPPAVDSETEVDEAILVERISVNKSSYSETRPRRQSPKVR